MKRFIRASARLAMLSACLLLIPATTGAQDQGRPEGKTQTDAVRPARGPQEGIKVHGRWVIEVQNADGTRVSRDEFENALDGGQITLASLMGRLMTGLVWHVTLHGPASDDPCIYSAFQTSPCVVAEPSHPGADGVGFLSKNLQLSVPRGANGIPLGTVELRGSITAQRAASIAEVRSGIDGFVANGQGGTIALFQQVFTAKQLPPAEWKRVEAGQIVQVTVVFSFS
jgi:hypothetical protein